jgi:hypothetical protein
MTEDKLSSKKAYKIACEFYVIQVLTRQRPDRDALRAHTRTSEAAIEALSVELFLKCIFIEEQNASPRK